MKQIASFTVNHDVLKKGFYISRIDGDIATYDIRMAIPNSGAYLTNPAIHTFEHLFATYVRNSALTNSIVYVGPMGCRTGFYFLTRGITHQQALDLFRDTFRGKMPLTDDYVFHAVFGRDTAESKGALMEILNIILARKQDPIRAISIKNPIETPEREMEKGTVMDIKAETDAGELLNIGRRVPRAKALHS